MDQQLMIVALRVLSAVTDGCDASTDDIDLLRKNALPTERDLALDDLASSTIYRIIDSPHPVPRLEEDLP
jgi:hypothetical protein